MTILGWNGRAYVDVTAHYPRRSLRMAALDRKYILCRGSRHHRKPGLIGVRRISSPCIIATCSRSNRASISAIVMALCNVLALICASLE